MLTQDICSSTKSFHLSHFYMQEFLRREIKPKTKTELVQGILSFWNTVNVDKCRRYISHLKKVIPRIIDLNGDATGY